MTAPSSQTYVDRRSGKRKTDRIHAPRFLGWSYDTRAGRLLTELIFSRRIVSWLYGWYAKRRWSRRRIAPFVAAMDVDMTESVRPIADFGSFNDFIIREIDLSRRPIDRDSDVCVSPADGRILVFPEIEADRSFRIKCASFDLRSFLRDDALVRAYAGGAMAVIRLYLADYHHVHFPADGVPEAPRSIPGRYLAVTPYSETWIVPFYRENFRMVTLVETHRFARIAIVEVGAFSVGSIQQRFEPEMRVAKGDHKSFFALGGSIVVLLFEPGAIRFDADLHANSRAGLETYIRFGESLGRSAR